MRKMKTKRQTSMRHAITEESKRKRNLAKAVAMTYEILGSQKPSRSDESTRIIRYWREHRYGPHSR